VSEYDDPLAKVVSDFYLGDIVSAYLRTQPDWEERPQAPRDQRWGDRRHGDAVDVEIAAMRQMTYERGAG
jgi:hypothetical protein